MKLESSQISLGSPVAITIGVGVLLFFLLPVSGITLSYTLLPLYNLGTIYAIFVSVCLYVRLVKCDPIGILAIAFATAMAFSCSLNHGALLDCITFYWPCSAIVLLARALITSFKKEFLSALVILLGLYTFANLLIILFVPVGTPRLYPDCNNTFFGYRNGFCRYYLPALFASLLLAQSDGKKLSALPIALFIAGVAQSLLCYSATSMLALAAVSVCYALSIARKARPKLNALAFSIGYLILFIAIVLLRAQNFFAPLFASMGRDVSFTERTAIWDAAIDLVDSEHFALGYNGIIGVISPEGMRSFSTAHNAVLDIMVWGGIVALGIAAAMILVCAVKLYKNRSSLSAATLSIYIGVFLLMGLVEYITCPPFFIFLGIAAGWDFGNKTKAIAGDNNQRSAEATL